LKKDRPLHCDTTDNGTRSVGLDLLLGLVIPSLGEAVFICGLEKVWHAYLSVARNAARAARLLLRPEESESHGSQARLRKRHFPLFEQFLLLAA
jgi:hypothetical protein